MLINSTLEQLLLAHKKSPQKYFFKKHCGTLFSLEEVYTTL